MYTFALFGQPVGRRCDSGSRFVQRLMNHSRDLTDHRLASNRINGTRTLKNALFKIPLSLPDLPEVEGVSPRAVISM